VSDTKISSLTAAASAAGTDELPINEGGTSKKLTVAQIQTLIMAGLAAGASEDFLTGNVTMTTAGTFYDGPSLSLTPGTYLLIGAVQLQAPSLAIWVAAKLWDGASSILENIGSYVATTGVSLSLPVRGVVVVAATTTYKISCACNVNAAIIQATTPAYGTANKASHLIALRLG
jgi:hypothetical protein